MGLVVDKVEVRQVSSECLVSPDHSHSIKCVHFSHIIRGCYDGPLKGPITKKLGLTAPLEFDSVQCTDMLGAGQQATYEIVQELEKIYGIRITLEI
jgi:hypothetical protein